MNKITITRKWNNPEIHHKVDIDGINLSVSLESFIEALCLEIGPVAWVFTEKAFRAKFDEAVSRVIAGIKEESAKVV